MSIEEIIMALDEAQEKAPLRSVRNKIREAKLRLMDVAASPHGREVLEAELAARRLTAEQISQITRATSESLHAKHWEESVSNEDEKEALYRARVGFTHLEMACENPTFSALLDAELARIQDEKEVKP